jgi:hypothetical protein
MDRIENTIGKGIVAGFVATFVLSVLLDPLSLVVSAVWPAPAVGWLIHFFIGTLIWGVAFAMLHDHLPGADWLRGLVFALGAWLVALSVGLALKTARLVAIDINLSLLASTLAIHVIYGVVLGAVYGWLLDREGGTSPTRRHREAPHLIR